MTHTRTHTKLPTGRRRVPLRPMIQLRDILTGVVPAHPAKADLIAQLRGGWQMLGNDAAGDCVAVRWANSRRLVTTLLTDKPSYPDQAQVWECYQLQNPGFVPGNGPHGYQSKDDAGMDSQALAEHLVSVGGPDGVKAVAFAQVDHRNLAEVEAAVAIFGEVWVDIIVLDGNQTEFSQGKPWTNDGSDIDGGHAVLGGGYQPANANTDPLLDIETWAAETALTPSFWSGVAEGSELVEVCYVVIWPEHFGSKSFQEGVNGAGLVAAYQAITGKTFTPPGVTPPAPTPGAAPFLGASPAVASHIVAAAAHAKLSTSDWLNHHFDSYFGLPAG